MSPPLFFNASARHSRALHPLRRQIAKCCGALLAATMTSACITLFSIPAQAATNHRSSPPSIRAAAAISKHAVVAGTHLSTATPGYWLASGRGEVGSYGGAPFHSSLGSVGIDAPVVALVPTPDGRGYWLAAADGGVFAFGDAVFHGSLAGRRLNARVVAMVPTPS